LNRNSSATTNLFFSYTPYPKITLFVDLRIAID
jgi:hypothetical protein